MSSRHRCRNPNVFQLSFRCISNVFQMSWDIFGGHFGGHFAAAQPCPPTFYGHFRGHFAGTPPGSARGHFGDILGGIQKSWDTALMHITMLGTPSRNTMAVFKKMSKMGPLVRYVTSSCKICLHLLTSILDRFVWVLGAKLGGKMNQTQSKKASKKYEKWKAPR